MSEVKRFDHVNHAHVDDCAHIENPGGAWVKASDYDALAAKLAMAEDAAAKGDAARQQCGGMEMEIEELRAELAALRARVLVLPDSSTVYAALDARERLFTSPENIRVALEAQSRLNGKTVSEGLLRSALTHAHNHGYLAGHHDTVEAQFSHILSSELDSYRSEQVEDILQALLGEGKEHD
ncbi:hypothetical protein ACM7V8_28520 [Pseudomonas aeruginosa]|uniref:hypothetical protein n=1 Tax=Pseudomonas aeruginosa TaxID=287 RepID=UPI000F626603|nr:hypothetical protein [Pseudomonas aeruginosa]RRI98735.1 hypothetical protein EIM06_06315 [Pseudomonas aeruginosa]HBO3869458.1 hypothetical protein [Pseudomonas aeruginosa]HCF6615918.1 hypothetical protein [Pseudomonas aeruginosa]HCL4190242.1 hypothetical protein [Pseudomonas aeruginosa]HCR1463629.1 hypothetical protein [Pseudomonas aeruginosa]